MTSIFMIGATLGDSIVPVVIGIAISLIGPASFPMAIILSSVLLASIYGAVHALSFRRLTVVKTNKSPRVDDKIMNPMQVPHPNIADNSNVPLQDDKAAAV